jgi:CelD/BcsL family acetyltransferase involved in cellulose biosynthesis
MSGADHREPVAARVIESEQAWDAIRSDWNALHAASPMASPPLDHAWLRGWWDVYAPTLPSASLRVVTVWRKTTLIGALPLYVHDGPLGLRHLRMISTGEAEFEETCPDYLNLLTRPGEEACCARRVWSEIARMRWDHLELLNLAASTPLLCPEAVPANVRPVAAGTCPVADLTGGFEAYLRNLSSNGRQQARRLLREGDRAGARLEIAAPGQLDSAFRDLVRLHQERWTRDGKPGVFSAERFVAFHRTLIDAWGPTGRAVLARLLLGAEVVATVYGFVAGAKFDFYQSGVRTHPAGPLRSPGNLTHLLLMKALSDRGVRAYDFLRGSSAYKKRLATGEHQLVGIELWRPTPRAAAWRAARSLARVTNASLRLVRRTPVDRRGCRERDGHVGGPFGVSGDASRVTCSLWR